MSGHLPSISRSPLAMCPGIPCFRPSAPACALPLAFPGHVSGTTCLQRRSANLRHPPSVSRPGGGTVAFPSIHGPPILIHTCRRISHLLFCHTALTSRPSPPAPCPSIYRPPSLSTLQSPVPDAPITRWDQRPAPGLCRAADITSQLFHHGNTPHPCAMCTRSL